MSCVNFTLNIFSLSSPYFDMLYHVFSYVQILHMPMNLSCDAMDGLYT
jgi:hypothetical protein